MEKIYFIRHNFKELSPVIEEHCKKNNCVAIHFNTEFHLNFSDYSEEAKEKKNFKQAFSLFKELGQEGGIVVAEYKNSEFYIGEVTPDTTIEAFNYEKQSGKPDDYYKILNLQNIKGPFSYSDYPLVSALRPPFVTICGLNDFSKNIILHLYRNTALALNVKNLHPKMLEQMCEEWLRTDLAGELKIKFELLQTGKTLPTIDIYARTSKGKDLLVQITHASGKSKVLAKAIKLKDYLTNRTGDRKSVGVFFAPAESERHLAEIDLVFISIESVFDQLIKSPDYREMLKTMIGINDQQEKNLTEKKGAKASSTAKKIENLVTKANEDVLEYGSLRQLLDCYSDEWQRTTLEQRIQVYQHLFTESKITEREITTAIQEYADYYDSIGKPHVKEEIVESLLKTLKAILSDHTLVKNNITQQDA